MSGEGTTPEPPQWTARYIAYGQPGQEELDSLGAAVAFLAGRWEQGTLSEVDIIAPDGTTALAGADLFQAMLDRIGA